MFRQDRTNPSTAVSNWRGRHDTAKGWPSTAVSSWLNGGLFGGPSGPAGAGYFAGGGVSGSYLSTVDRFLFADDSRTTLGTGLSAATYRLAGNASSVAGYFGGGDNDAGATREVTTVDRFLFADDTRTTLAIGLTAVAKDLAGMANLGA